MPRPSRPLFVFVGDRRSSTAIRRGWTWESGHLSAKTLFDALRTCGVAPEKCIFVNAYRDDGTDNIEGLGEAVRWSSSSVPVMALGARAALMLEMLSCHYTKVRHPAARGRGRLREAYTEHVRAAIAKATGG